MEICMNVRWWDILVLIPTVREAAKIGTWYLLLAVFACVRPFYSPNSLWIQVGWDPICNYSTSPLHRSNELIFRILFWTLIDPGMFWMPDCSRFLPKTVSNPKNGKLIIIRCSIQMAWTKQKKNSPDTKSPLVSSSPNLNCTWSFVV